MVSTSKVPGAMSDGHDVKSLVLVKQKIPKQFILVLDAFVTAFK